MYLAALHCFGSCVAFSGGFLASDRAGLSRAVPATVAVAALGALIAVPTTYLTRIELVYPHPTPTTSVYIPLDDGVRLAADIYFPSGIEASGPLAAGDNETNTTTIESSAAPVVVQFTRYGRSFSVQYPFNKFSIFDSTSPFRAPGVGVAGAVVALRNAGYVVVNVDVRGTGASFGRRSVDLHPRELKDHTGVVTWIREQPWCNGTVAAMGAGIDGTASALAAARGALVNAVATVDAPADPYTDQLAPGGMVCHSYLQGASSLAAAAETAASMAALVSTDDSGWIAFTLRHAYGGVAAVAGWESATEKLYSAHANNFDLRAHAESADTMLFHDDVLVTGKTQNLSFATINAASRITAGLTKHGVPLLSAAGYTVGRAAAAAARLHNDVLPGGSKLVLGPWGGAGKTCVNGATDVCTATPVSAAIVDFMDCVLRGRCTSTESVQFHTADGWQSAASWPPPDRASATTLFLGTSGLVASAPATESVDFTVDPSATTGVESRWNTARGLVGLPVVYKSGGTARLSFESTPFDTATTLTGSPFLSLTLEAVGGDDMAVFAYIEELRADGTAAYVTEGQVLASHPTSGRVSDATPGHPAPVVRSFARAARAGLTEATRVELALEPVAHTFAAGSSLRLSLAGADADNFNTAQLETAPAWKVHIGEAFVTLLMQ